MTALYNARWGGAYPPEEFLTARVDGGNDSVLYCRGGDQKMPQAEEMTRQTNIRLPKRMVERLKRVAREQAVEKDRDVSFSDLIREAIEHRFPPEETDEK